MLSIKLSKQRLFGLLLHFNSTISALLKVFQTNSALDFSKDLALDQNAHLSKTVQI